MKRSYHFDILVSFFVEYNSGQMREASLRYHMRDSAGIYNFIIIFGNSSPFATLGNEHPFQALGNLHSLSPLKRKHIYFHILAEIFNQICTDRLYPPETGKLRHKKHQTDHTKLKVENRTSAKILMLYQKSKRFTRRPLLFHQGLLNHPKAVRNRICRSGSPGGRRGCGLSSWLLSR